MALSFIKFSLLLSVLLITVSLVISCEYHEMLKRLRQQQLQERQQQLQERQRLQRLRQGWSNSYRNRESLYRPTSHSSQHSQHSVPLSSSRLSSGSSSSNRQRYRDHINANPSVNRYTAYNSQRGYYVNSHDPTSQRQVYIGSVSTVYNPEEYVSCPNSEYHVCPLGTSCVYRFGRFRCVRPTTSTRSVCRKGFERVNITSTHYQCRDIDECNVTKSNNCEYECRNTHGSYRCSCPRGYRVLANGSCSDVDECSRSFCQFRCVNTLGSYNCECPNGYKKVSSFCRDIDECTNTSLCGDGERCLNTFGGYECYSSDPCPEGYSSYDRTFGVCVNHGKSSSLAPDVISSNRYALQANRSGNHLVGEVRYQTRNRHLYRNKIVSGNRNFKIIRRGSGFRIYPQRVLPGPAVYDLSVEINDYNLDSGTTKKSLVNMSFVVSQYTF